MPHEPARSTASTAHWERLLNRRPTMAARGAVIRAKAISDIFRGEVENMAAVAQRRMPARAYLSSGMPPTPGNEQL